MKAKSNCWQWQLSLVVCLRKKCIFRHSKTNRLQDDRLTILEGKICTCLTWSEGPSWYRVTLKVAEWGRTLDQTNLGSHLAFTVRVSSRSSPPCLPEAWYHHLRSHGCSNSSEGWARRLPDDGCSGCSVNVAFLPFPALCAVPSDLQSQSRFAGNTLHLVWLGMMRLGLPDPREHHSESGMGMVPWGCACFRPFSCTNISFSKASRRPRLTPPGMLTILGPQCLPLTFKSLMLQMWAAG